MSETGYAIHPIFDQEVTDELVENCRADACERAQHEGGVVTDGPPEIAHLTFPGTGRVRCLRFEVTR